MARPFLLTPGERHPSTHEGAQSDASLLWTIGRNGRGVVGIVGRRTSSMQSFRSLLISTLLALAAVSAFAQDGPKAPVPVSQFLARLARAKTLCFTARQWMPDPTDFERK